MRSRTMIVAAAFLLPGAGYAADICVQNGGERALVFAAEAEGGVRELATLATGETLCSSGGKAGVVSVFESLDALEGCSRLVTSDTVEMMIQYHDFDRCLWSSNS